MKAPHPKGMRLTSIALENWRNFAQARVALQRRAFLIGPNASGKSNLLDAVRFLRDIVSVGGGLQAAVAKRGGVSKLRCLAARRHPTIAVEVTIGTDASPNEWEYRLEFGQDSRQRPSIIHERVVRSGLEVLRRPMPEDEQDPERLTQTYLEQVQANREFREVADFLASVRYMHIIPQLVREPDRSVGRSSDPYGGDFLEQIAATNERTRRSRLARIADALRIAVPQLKELELWQDRGTPHLRGRYEHWRPQGAWQTEEQFSDGTLRLMGLLWALLDGGGPLLLEEPELSLHPDIVRHVPQMFARVQRTTRRQILVSTHSPDILEDRGIGLDEVLLLEPGPEGTIVRPAGDLDEIRALVDSGMSLAEAAIPHTRPAQAGQLSLFGG